MNIACWYRFLPPTLRRCVLPVYSESKSIGTHRAVLEELSIWLSAGGRTSDGLSVLSDTVRLCKRLVKLHCPPLDSAAWKHLSNLHTFLTLDIQGQCYPSDWGNLEFGPFLNITTISFTVDKVADIITLIHHSEFPSLKMFELKVQSKALSWAEIERLFRALSRCNACQTLEVIVIRSYTLGHPFTVVRHLFCFMHLQTLSLYSRFRLP
jgi:hypothetical protein